MILSSKRWGAGLLGAVMMTGVLSTGSPELAWAKPYSEAEIRAVESPDESKIREIRGQEINQLRIALGRRSAVNRRAELYFRLAEIYVEAYRQTFLLEGRVHEKRLASSQEDKFIDRTLSKPFLESAIRACQDVVSLRIPYEKLDQIYYFLGFSHSELGRRKQGLTYFEHLTRQFPSSPFAGEAYRELGDSAFAEGQFRKAQSYYEQALKRSPPEMLPRIHHKLAWSFYRQKQYDRAVLAMKEAVTAASQSGEKYLSLREEALRDMAVFMTEGGRVEEAIGYFQSISGDKNFYPKVLERLGKQYERNVEPVKATQVYESLLKTNPGSDAGYRVLVKLVDLDLRRGRFKEALVRLKDVKPYEGSDQETQVAAQNLRAMVRRTATEHHEKYRKNSERAELEIAESYYSAYLKLFLAKDDPRNETPEIQMYLAEVKRDLGRSKEASALYRQVVGSKDKRYAKEAGALWTASLAEAIKKAAPVAANGAGLKSGEPSELEKEYVEAADRMQEALGETPEAREAALRAAQVLAGYRNTQKDAIKRLQKIISRWTRSKQALTAARLWVQLKADPVPTVGASLQALEAASGAVDDLTEVLEELRGNQALLAFDNENGGKLKAQLSEQELRLKIFSIARFEKDRDYKAAAKGYEALALESSQREFSEKAFENSAANYSRAGDLENMERLIGVWLKRFPKSARAIDSIRAGASTQLIAGRFELAARLFEKSGREGGDPASLETAARLFDGAGDVVKAQALWRAHLEIFPKAPTHWKVALLLAKSFESHQNDGEAGKIYQQCMNGSTEMEAACGAKLADLHMRAGNAEQAKGFYKKVAALSEKGKSEGASPYIGYARYRMAEFIEKSIRMAPLKLPDTELKKGMQSRQESLEALGRAYQSVVEAGGPWAIAALERLATAVMQFADDLDRIVPPPGASSEAVAKFRKNIDTVSGPLRKKALATWSEGYSKAVAVELLSPVLPRLADRLADYKAGGIFRAQGFRGRLRLAGIAADGGNESRSAALQRTRDRLYKNAEDVTAWVDYGNLLWGEGRPGLAKLAYDRALALNPRNSQAMNNRAVLELTGGGMEDWLNVAEGAQLLQNAVRQDDFFLVGKYNRAVVLSYYRIFQRAKPLWEQVTLKDGGVDAWTGLAIAQQGAGESAAAEQTFKKAAEKGLSTSSFEFLYHQVARRVAATGASGAENCLKTLGDLDAQELITDHREFEKESFEHLKGVCEAWKSSN